MNINLKRAYEPAAKSDGKRFLVDRLWPRGISKEKLDATWIKDVAPSNDLRKWFNHDDAKFPEFKKKYEQELSGSAQQQIIKQLKAEKGTITLVYGAKDEQCNNAVVLKDYLLNK